MVKIRRNLSTPEGRAFWKNVSKAKAQIKQMPRWIQDAWAERNKKRSKK